MSNLVNLRICGHEKHYVPESHLGAIPLPQQTASYQPVGHLQFLDMVRSNVEKSGLRVLQEVHSLARKGLRYFGMMQVESNDLFSRDMGFVIGLRNSFDKAIPAAIAVGNSVFVCDNLQFNGEIVLGRRHTTNILRDLPSMIATAIAGLTSRWQSQIIRMDTYKETGLTDMEAHDIIARAFLRGAVSQKQVAEVIGQWHNPNHPEFQDRNAYSLHNAFTEVWKQNTPDIVLANSSALHSILDGVCVTDIEAEVVHGHGAFAG